VLGGGRALSLRQIMDGSGFARQTVYSHLRHLVAAGIASREAVRHGRGRPTILYRLFKPSIEGVELLDVVALTFQKLRHACRFEEGGWCRKIKSSCTAEKCPLAIK
jgi:predicted ArsR family transcriptional regulator